LLTAAALAVSGGGLVLGGAGIAGASSSEVSAVGSFTTFDMMSALFPTSVNNINPNPLTGSNTLSIAADSATCVGGVTYSSTNQPPNGSGAGKSALFAEETAAATAQGCIDFSRSSSEPAPHTLSVTYTTGDPTGSHFDYYAYALDGVMPIVGSNSGSTRSVQVSVTLAQMQEIYSCWNPTTSTVVNTWAQAGVGTNTDTINRFWPQSGSGTLAVYRDALGFDPTNLTLTHHCATAPITSFTLGSNTAVNEENSQDGMVYANSLGSGTGYYNTADDIYIYSAGKFAEQWNDTTHYNSTASNKVAVALGATSTNIGNIDTNSTTALTPAQVSSHPYVDYTAQSGLYNANTNRGTFAVDTTTVSEGNEWYSHLPAGTNPTNSTGLPGVRYVYNVADTALPGYNGAKGVIGFDNKTSGVKSALCNGDDSATITSQGFVPLNTGSTAPTGSDAAGSTCREFPGLAFPSQASPISIHWLP